MKAWMLKLAKGPDDADSPVTWTLSCPDGTVAATEASASSLGEIRTLACQVQSLICRLDASPASVQPVAGRLFRALFGPALKRLLAGEADGPQYYRDSLVLMGPPSCLGAVPMAIPPGAAALHLFELLTVAINPSFPGQGELEVMQPQALFAYGPAYLDSQNRTWDLSGPVKSAANKPLPPFVLRAKEQGNVQDLLVRLQNYPLAVLVCHGRTDPNSDICELVLSACEQDPNAEVLRVSHVRGLHSRVGCRVLITAACVSASDIDVEKGLTRSFADAGVRFLLAPLAKVEVGTALAFARAFMALLAEGHTAGEAYYRTLKQDRQYTKAGFLLIGDPDAIPLPGLLMAQNQSRHLSRLEQFNESDFWTNRYRGPVRIRERRSLFVRRTRGAMANLPSFASLEDAIRTLIIDSGMAPRPLVLIAKAHSGKTTECLALLTGKGANGLQDKRLVGTLLPLRRFFQGLAQQGPLGAPNAMEHHDLTLRLLAQATFEKDELAHQRALDRQHLVVLDAVDEIDLETFKVKGGDLEEGKRNRAAVELVVAWIKHLVETLHRLGAKVLVTCRSDEIERGEGSLLLHEPLRLWPMVEFEDAKRSFPVPDIFEWITRQVTDPNRPQLNGQVHWPYNRIGTHLCKLLSGLALASRKLALYKPTLTGNAPGEVMRETRRIFGGDRAFPAWWPREAGQTGEVSDQEDVYVLQKLCEGLGILELIPGRELPAFSSPQIESDLIYRCFCANLLPIRDLDRDQLRQVFEVVINRIGSGSEEDRARAGELFALLFGEWARGLTEGCPEQALDPKPDVKALVERVDPRLLELLAVRLGRTKMPRCIDLAIELMETLSIHTHKPQAETLGILGGALKKRSLAQTGGKPDPKHPDLEKCYQAYHQGWETTDRLNTFTGINTAALLLWLGREQEAQGVAAQVLCLLSPEDKGHLKEHPIVARDFWDIVTAAEAHLIRREYKEALEVYGRGFEYEGSGSSLIPIAVQQARIHAEVLGGPEAQDFLRRLDEEARKWGAV